MFQFKLFSTLSIANIFARNIIGCKTIDEFTSSIAIRLPTWAQKIMNPGGDFETFALNWFVINATTTETIRLTAGFFLREILGHCTKKLNSMLQPDVSLWMYFAHDTTITYVLNALKLYTVNCVAIQFLSTEKCSLFCNFFLQLQRIPYAACLFFELYQNGDDPYMQVLYKNSTQENVTTFEIPDCGTKCPLDRFYKLYADILPTKSFEEECMIHDDEAPSIE